ncbi:carboxypeptidase-like regulatory domain-containing protein, partial [Calditrichota bacterium]
MVKKNKPNIILCLLFFALFLQLTLLFAGTTGKIAGIIKDQDNSEPLVGVNVVVDGTGLGAATDLDGIYIIMNVPPGLYNVQAIMLGYKTVSQENIQVYTDLTSKADFDLEISIFEGETIIVQAERPLVKRDETSKTAILDFQVFSEMPIQEVSEAIAAQSGITTDEAGNLHLRGGRSGEVAYMIDGILVQDPFYKSGAAGVLLDKYLIQELQVMTGAFSAEYGQAMSGVINVVTKEGTTQKYSGRIEYESHWLNESPYRKQDWILSSDLVDIPAGQENEYRDALRWYRWSNENPDSLVSSLTQYDPVGFSKYNVPNFESIPGTGDLPKIFGTPLTGYYTASLSGPIPFIDNLSFFMSGRYSNYYSHLQFGYDANRDLNIKLTYRLDDIKINSTIQRSRRYYKPYSHQWKYNPQGYEDRKDIVDRESVELTHVLGEKTFYTVRLSRYLRGYL